MPQNNMKQLIWQLVIPLTIFFFVGITKWWYVVVVDGWDIMMTGFPLPYSSSCFHTSLCLQIFVFELIIDLLFYFTVWFLLIFLFNKFIKQITLPRGITIALLSISGILVAGMLFIGFLPDNILMLKKDFEYEVLDSGIDVWQTRERPELNDYRPKNPE